MAEKSTDDRIRDKAYELWEADGRPDGRDEFHWSQARQIIALEDSSASTLISLAASLRDPAEPAVAFENQATQDGLTSQDDGDPGPNWAAAAVKPSAPAVDKKPKKPAAKRAAAKVEEEEQRPDKKAAKQKAKKKS